MIMHNQTDQLITRLAALDSCAIADALDSLSLPPAVSGIRRLSTNRKIYGRVITVELAAGKPEGGSKQHLCTRAIEAAGAGDIVVVQQSTGIDAAGWGGVLSTGASLAKLGGVIIEGPARDIDEAIMLDFPVYARNSTPRTARNRIHERNYNCPVMVGEVQVLPGDFVLADSTGIVFIPAARIAEVLETAERIASREQLMVADLRKGAAITGVMGKNYETMLDN